MTFIFTGFRLLGSRVWFLGLSSSLSLCHGNTSDPVQYAVYQVVKYSCDTTYPHGESDIISFFSVE
jgi:hypothetical protein